MSSKISNDSPAHTLASLFTNNKIRIRYIDDAAYTLEENEVSEEDIEKIIEQIGETKLVYEDNEKEDVECIETSVVHFEKYDLYIKEVAVGECHYRDVAIDGIAESVEYILVERKEIVTVDYVEISAL